MIYKDYHGENFRSFHGTDGIENSGHLFSRHEKRYWAEDGGGNKDLMAQAERANMVLGEDHFGK